MCQTSLEQSPAFRSAISSDRASPVDGRPDIAPATKMAHDRASLRDEGPMKIAIVGGGIGGLRTALTHNTGGPAATVAQGTQEPGHAGWGHSVRAQYTPRVHPPLTRPAPRASA